MKSAWAVDPANLGMMTNPDEQLLPEPCSRPTPAAFMMIPATNSEPNSINQGASGCSVGGSIVGTSMGSRIVKSLDNASMGSSLGNASMGNASMGSSMGTASMGNSSMGSSLGNASMGSSLSTASMGSSLSNTSICNFLGKNASSFSNNMGINSMDSTFGRTEPNFGLSSELADHQSISATDLVVTGGLGQGGYACVVQARHTITGDAFALKVISKARNAKPKGRKCAAVELKILTEIPPSPFLVTCHSAFETKNDVYLVLELVGGGDLFLHLAARFESTSSGFTESEARVILAELVCAVTHLHSAGFVHRDIKVENVMLDTRGHVKLIDFGHACEITNGLEAPMSPIGSLIYMAPELLSERVGGRHTDWWAVGILAYEVMTGRSPWSSISEKEVIMREILGPEKILPPTMVPRNASQFITGLLEKDRRRRLGSMSDMELFRSPFFEAIDWAATANQQAAPAFFATWSVPASNAGECDAALGRYLTVPRPRNGEISYWFTDLQIARGKPPYVPSSTLYGNRF